MKFQLKPDNRNASDDELIKDLLKVADQLGSSSIKMRDYNKIGRFHSGTITRRFNGWNKALERAGLKVKKQVNISDEELMADIKRVALKIAPQKLTQKIYNRKGKFTSQTITERLGWNKTLKALRLETSLDQDISEKELFDNLETLWIKLGHAPRRRDMVKPISKYSERPYLNKYGSWRKTLESFVEHINSDSTESQKPKRIIKQASAKTKVEPFRHKTKRDISEKLKVRVLIRDGNKCRLCGVTVTGENIHFDHIKPWSKGGETVLDNIQVLCAKHNLAKSDFYESA